MHGTPHIYIYILFVTQRVIILFIRGHRLSTLPNVFKICFNIIPQSTSMSSKWSLSLSSVHQNFNQSELHYQILWKLSKLKQPQVHTQSSSEILKGLDNLGQPRYKWENNNVALIKQDTDWIKVVIITLPQEVWKILCGNLFLPVYAN
jgi:hypothetical protein